MLFRSIALATGDLDQLLERLEQEGIPIVKGPLEIPATVRWLYVADPDRNIIEFVQWTSSNQGRGQEPVERRLSDGRHSQLPRL